MAFTERLVVDLQTRYRNSLAMLGDPTVTTDGVPIPGVTFTSLNLNYQLPVGAATMDLFLNVQNAVQPATAAGELLWHPAQRGSVWRLRSG